jgi:hypothetical protein
MSMAVHSGVSSWSAAGSFRPARQKARIQANAAKHLTFSTGIGPHPIRQRRLMSRLRSGDLQAMATNTTPPTEVLHSENHSKLSSEQIAKALARHNKNHSPAKAENIALKAKKPAKG